MANAKKRKKWSKRDWFDLILVLICIPILAIGFAVSLSIYQTKQKGGVTTIMGRCFLTVQSPSMEPVLMTGETFVCKTIEPSKVKEGDIISFFYGKKIITHKVHFVGQKQVDGKLEYFFVTYGINNKTSTGEYYIDDYIVPESQLIGIYSGRSSFNKFAGFLTSKWGMFCFVIVPLGVLIITDILSLISYIGPKKPKKEQENEAETESDNKITPAPEIEPEITLAPESEPEITPAPESEPEITPAPESEPEITLATESEPEITPAPEIEPEITPAPEIERKEKSKIEKSKNQQPKINPQKKPKNSSPKKPVIKIVNKPKKYK